MSKTIRTLCAAIAFAGVAGPSFAVEGGLGAYLPGSRDTFAGFVPGAGTYFGVDIINSQGSVQNISMAGYPVAGKADLNLTFAKLSITHAFDATVWGGTPALNLNIPYVIDAKLDFLGSSPPALVGVPIQDKTSGIGDITITPMVGWHKDRLHYSAALSVFAPTGGYHTAIIDVPTQTIDVLNTGKNIWSFQPVFAVTHFDPANGLEFSGAASALFSTRNDATDYQNAPTLTLEGTAMQHLKSGWAFGMSGYWYQQIGDDSGSGADNTKAALLTNDLTARVFGLGPIITFKGATIFGKDVDLKLKYYKEFGAKNRFESDVLWFNFSFKI
jgi:hypothetical protein